MESIILICALIIVAIIGYKTGKWSKEWEIGLLQDDNVKLSGEVHRLRKEIDRANTRFIQEIFPENNIIKKQEETKWD